MDRSALISEHAARTAQTPRVFFAPGRVNLLGEHTDYAEGFCMPSALQFGTMAAISPREDSAIQVHSTDLGESFSFDMRSPQRPRKDWTDYVAGVVTELLALRIPLRGAELTLAGDVPRGAGLSSSASLEVSVAIAMLHLADVSLDKTEVAKLCRRAENNFVGAASGIMDPFASLHGESGAALALDCRDLSYVAVPLPASTRLVITNSMVKHSVAGGEYTERRAQVEEGTHILQRLHPEADIRTLRDVTPRQWIAAQPELDDVTLRRGRHVITDSARVQQGAAMLRDGRVEAFGRLMNEAHASYRDDFGASCAECDALVEIAQHLPGCLGSRLTGGGFGGCTVSLVRTPDAAQFREQLLSQYRDRTGISAESWICEAAQGAREIA